ncbi:flagellin N-terminal helical domain-containing protein [Duganella sp. S19_KUP01_CR8]|uniref:flagellin N-terminal helical domain-containing protein n=1 Tax=Duganella sp. S19_KUP01_CR8 TaxID=3025502 RepID=UPI002FCDC416
MLSLHTNAASLSAQNALFRTESRTATAMTRLGTGYRVNSARDDAAGLQIATRLVAQTHGMTVARSNIQKDISILQTADGALNESTTILIRMKDLAIQAADGSATATDRDAMQAEYTALSHELSNISSTTTFGGSKLLQGDTVAERAGVIAATANAVANAANAAAAHAAAMGAYNAAAAADAAGSTQATQVALAAALATATAAAASSGVAAVAATDAQDYAAAVALVVAVNGKFSNAVWFQIGASASETMEFNLTPLLSDMHTALHAASTTYDTFGVQVKGRGTDLVLASVAATTIDQLQLALDAVASVRSSLGSAVSRLNHSDNNLANTSANTVRATGRIMDTDFAQESAEMLSNQMLMKAGSVVLRDSHSISTMLMSLLK